MFGHYSHTGFGVVTESLGREFVARGVDVRVLAVNHRGEPVRGPLAGRVWPANMFGDGFGGNLSSKAIDGSLWTQLDGDDDWRPDQVLVVADMSGFQGHIGKVTPPWLSLPVWHYCPIEGDNLPVSWRDIWNQPGHLPDGTILGGPFRPVAMSRYGQRVITEHIGREVPFIYHGVDSETFRPASVAHPLPYKGQRLSTKEACKAALGFPASAKIVLRTDRHVPRKFYHSLFTAMIPVMAADPDVVLLIHCRPTDEGGNLLEELARMPRNLWPRVKFTGAHDTWRGLPTDELVVLINAADVYATTTSGEGFGLTIAEALACEVPVVSTGWAAEVEVVGPGGILVPPLRDVYGDTVTYHSTYGMDWAVPDWRGFVDPILALLNKPSRRREFGRAGRRHVVNSFRWPDAADQFMTLFDSASVSAEVAA